MMKLESSYLDLSYIDLLARQNNFLQQLDPRAKLLTTLLFITAVVSFDKYALSGLIPFLIYPLSLLVLGSLPPGYLFKRILVAAPFALFIGVFNPILDREIMVRIGEVGISGGWISFASIMLRFTLTVSAALILIATTGFNEVCLALRKMGMPAGLSVQLLFLFRYLFVLIEEAARMSRAREVRSFGGKGMGMKVFSHMIGQLLLRTIDRARRIHLGMLCRGFDGELRLLRTFRWRWRDAAFVLVWAALFAAMRRFDVPRLIGDLVLGVKA